MALDTSPTMLLQEVEEELNQRRKQTDKSRDLIRQFAGDDYRTDWSNVPAQTFNYFFMVVSNAQPHLVHGKPAAKITSLDGMEDDPEVEAIQLGINHWHVLAKPTAPLKLIANDMFFDFGVGMVRNEIPEEDLDLPAQDQRRLPMLHRISPRRYFQDTHFVENNRPRFTGHIVVKDREDMLRAVDRDGNRLYDHKAIESISVNDGIVEVQNELINESLSGIRMTRDMVVFFEIHDRETNTIHTLAQIKARSSGTQAGAFLRAPRRYAGPRSGPFVLFGLHGVPDCAYPLSPLAVSAGMVRELVAHRAQAREDAARAKNLVFVAAQAKRLAEAAATQPSGSVIPLPDVPDLERNVKALSLGGAHPENLTFIQRAERDLERLNGITATAAGEITGATKGEVQAAQSERQDRITAAKETFRQCYAECLGIVVELLGLDDRIKFKMPITDKRGRKIEMAEFQGGPAPGQRIITASNTSIEIDPYSIEMTTGAQLRQQFVMMLEILTTTLELSMNYPFFKPAPFLDDAFEAHNIREAADRYIDLEMLDQLQGVERSVQYLRRSQEMVAGILGIGSGQAQDGTTSGTGEGVPQRKIGGRVDPNGEDDNRVGNNRSTKRMAPTRTPGPAAAPPQAAPAQLPPARSA